MASEDRYKGLGFGTKAIHAGVEPDPSSGAVITPISLSTTFQQSSPGVHLVCIFIIFFVVICCNDILIGCERM